MGSIFVFIAILVVIGIAAYMTVNAFSRESKKGIGARCVAITACIAAVVFTLAVANYLDPSDRSVEFELYAVVELDKPHSNKPGAKYWEGAHDGSVFGYCADTYLSMYGERWPELDVSNYSYIISYGQELFSLTYNIWNTIDIPVRTGLYQGNAIFNEEFDPYAIYIYQIPKLKIDNYP